MILVFMFNSLGCWDARDIERLSFPYAGAYDLHINTGGNTPSSDPREFPLVDVTVLNPNLSPTAEVRASIDTVTASLVAYARDKRVYNTPEIYFPSLNQVLLTGEDLARTGLMRYFNSLIRAPNIAVTMNLAVVEGRGEEILRTPSIDYPTIGVQLRAMLRNSERKGFVPSTTLHHFVVNLVAGKNPVVPMIAKVGDQINFTGLAIFKKDLMIAKLDPQDTRSLVLLRGIKCTGSLPFFFGMDGQNQERGVVRVRNSRQVKVTRDGDKYTFVIKIKLNGILVEHVPSSPVITEEKLGEIENIVAGDIQQDCTNLIRLMQQEHKVDCIDIQKYALAKWRNQLEPTIDEGDFIQKADIRCQVECNIRNTGEVR